MTVKQYFFDKENPMFNLLFKWKAREGNPTDLRGKVAIVTGANSGIGEWTTIGLLKRGMNVIMACRNDQRVTDAKERILKHVDPLGSGKLYDHFPRMDLLDNDSIVQFTSQVKEEFPAIDLVVCNAGVAIPLGKQSVEDKYEQMFQIMVLGHYLLVELLLPNISRTGQVIVLASNAQLFVHKDIDKLPIRSLALTSEFRKTKTFRSSMGMGYQYGHVKLMTVWLTLGWHRLYHDRTGIRFNCLHPGATKSRITTRDLFEFQKPFAAVITKAFFSPTPQGAETTLHVAMTKDISGHFFQMAMVRDSLMSKRGPDEKKQDELLRFLWGEVGDIIRRECGDGEGSMNHNIMDKIQHPEEASSSHA